MTKILLDIGADINAGPLLASAANINNFNLSIFLIEHGLVCDESDIEVWRWRDEGQFLRLKDCVEAQSFSLK